MNLQSVFNGGKRLAAATLLGTWVAAPVWGDDTEIFFGNFQGGDFRPNVLFIMDTSGSMRSRPNEDTRDSKIDIVKEALRTLAAEVNGVNVGLMRFSNPGGPIIYPVTYIDKEISEFGTGEKTVTSQISRDDEDATELLGTGAVDVARAFSAVGSAVETNSVTYYVGEGDEDAHQSGLATINVFDRELDLQGVGDTIGIRFWEADDIAQGAEILDARLTMTLGNSQRNITESLTVSVRGNEIPAPDFATLGVTLLQSPDGLRQLTDASVNWAMNDENGFAPGRFDEITSPNIASVIQEIVDHPDWGRTSTLLGLLPLPFNNDIVLILEQTADSHPDAKREFRSRDARADASRLTITFADGSGESSYASGLVFGDVAVPQNATITSATLELTPSNTVDGAHTLAGAVTIGAEASGFSGSNGEISGRIAAATATGDLAVDSWVENNIEQLDVTSLLQSAVNDADWCGGQSIGLMLSNVGDRLDFHAYDGDPSRAPQLRVTYDADSVSAGNTCVETTQTKRITASQDDVEATNSSGSNYYSSRDYIYLNSGDWAALRFDDFPLPSDAVITSAYLHLNSDRDQTGSSTLTLSVENTDDSEPLLAGAGLTGRSWAGGVSWNISEDWDYRDEFISPDISSLLNTVLARGFSSGNAITLRADLSSGNARIFDTYDDNPVYAAMLEVNFQSSGSDSFNTARTEFVTAIDSLSAEGFTPIQDTLFEAYQYYAGNPAIWGRYRGGHDQNGNRINVANESADSEPFWYTRVSVQDSITPESWGGVVRPPGCTEERLSDYACDDYNGPGQPEGEYLAGNPIYKTPIEHECQFESHIVFLTDGAANEPHSESLIKSAIGASSCPSSGSSSQACVVELAEHMFEQDMAGDLEGRQKVITHMVGFDFDEPWLEQIADAGGGTYATANDLDSLVSEFKSIIAEVLKTDTSFVAPVAAINSDNRLTNLNDVYFAVFKPEGVPAWPGNLKRYQLGISSDGNFELIDANGNPAVDPLTGFFKETSRSFWSATADGSNVESGGANASVPSFSSRKIYTDLGIAPTTLSSAANAIALSNALTLSPSLGLALLQDPTDTIEWIMGKDTEDEDGDGVTSENRHVIGDPLHSQPVAVNYGRDANGDPDVTLFFGTNAGNLHAVDGDTGAEVFSYIPRELLPLQERSRENDGAQSHFYGLDGSPSLWIENNGSESIDAAEGDHVYLYIGQRRGGNNYYALDVTNRAAPRLMWKINGGSGDFADLGQSWARPIPGRLNVNGTETDVLYISGGHDEANDDEVLRNTSADPTGNAIYVVNALTGAKIWSAGGDNSHDLVLADMIHAIPATSAVYDVDRDGLDDGLFVGDTGGQVWRIDFNQGNPVSTLATGGTIAKLGAGGAADASANRRFFHSADVVLTKVGGALKLAVALGSGSRPAPLSERVNDRFYTIFQDAVYSAPSTYSPVFEGDDPDTGTTETSSFFDATSNILQTGDASETAIAAADLADSSGWFIEFTRSGEKVLSRPTTFQNVVAFTTYEPRNIANSCTPKAGTSRVYFVSLLDGTVPDEELSLIPPELIDDLDRSRVLEGAGIPPEIKLFFPDGTTDEVMLGVGPNFNQLNISTISRSYWRQD